MRYFQIYADGSIPQPYFVNWYQTLQPGKLGDQEIFDRLEEVNNYKVEVDQDLGFMDIILHPFFMVSKEFADLIRVYDKTIPFKILGIYDRKNKKAKTYQVPNLQEIDCLAEDSVYNIDKSRVVKGILIEEKMKGYPIFKLGGVKSRYIIANLEFVESAYRRRVRGMKIKEFEVQ